MENFSTYLAGFSLRQDSIFYFLLFLSAAFYVVAETIALMRRGKSPAPRSTPNLKAPLGWALLPAILLVSLSFVHWRKEAPVVESERSPAAFVFYAR
jgi:hypothetical protein